MTRFPDPDEAAAIAAAVERFNADTAPAAAPDEPATGAWQRAALIEGVSAKGGIQDLEDRGGAKWLS